MNIATQSASIPVPNLKTANQAPLTELEQTIIDKFATIEAWFRKEWQTTPAPITSSVDLRISGTKIAPVDTNLFPAGFNNLNHDFLPLCIQAAQSVLAEYLPGCTKILILPENHTRNKFYQESLFVLQDIFTKAGFVVRIGSLDPNLKTPESYSLESGNTIILEPTLRENNKISLKNFNPCFLLLNNDLSTGIPEILKNLSQNIQPTTQIGWTSRLKSNHFHYYSLVADEFSSLIGIDPWLIKPYFTAVDDIDFMAKEGLDKLAPIIDELLQKVQEKYTKYNISERPFVAVKADNGTYGMSVMMVQSGEVLKNLNRKQRTRMAASKGSQKVSKVIVQEGVYTFETMPDNSVAEPVVYMIGQYVIGGFYRVHKARGIAENLNAPGMHFEPLAFADPCNLPQKKHNDYPNRFYTYGVIARLAAIAASREIAAIKGK